MKIYESKESLIECVNKLANAEMIDEDTEFDIKNNIELEFN